MLNVQTTVIAFAIGLAVGGGSAWKLTASYKDNAHTAAIAAQKIEAAAQLQAATERAIATERANIKLADKVEADHAASKTKLDRALADNRRLAADLGGLRDPGSRPSGDCTVPAGAEGPTVAAGPAAGAGLPTASQGLLSRAASEFILRLARDADEAAEYAGTCHAWIRGLTP